MINYERLGHSVAFYKSRGYEPIEVPWVVTNDAVESTLPDNSVPLSIGYNKVLVGSAEQSFVQMLLDNKIGPGKYQAITPCFREEKEDEFHQKYFMKNELILIPPQDFLLHDLDDCKELRTIMKGVMLDAMEFYKQYLPEVNIVLDNFFDLQSKGVELGSYGIRNYYRYVWIFGTGLAEPRLSQVQSLYEKENQK